MKISVIGVGHVGLVTAAGMADLGHDVISMDDDGACDGAGGGGGEVHGAGAGPGSGFGMR